MIRLTRADVFRLVKNKLYIFGVAAAMFGTIYSIKGGLFDGTSYPESTPLGYMKLISVGVMIFMSVFTALFFGKDYSDGIIRNKLIAGYKRHEIFLGDMASAFVAVLGMTAAWLIGGVISGVDFFSSALAVFTIKMILFSMAYEAILCLLSIFITNVSAAAAISVVLMQMMLFGSFISGNIYDNMAEGTINKSIFKMIINISPFGQWANNTIFGVGIIKGMDMGTLYDIIVSVVIVAVCAIVGIMNLNKKDLK